MNLINLDAPRWGPTGEEVYRRTYSRTKADGTKETWRETVTRVVDGNLSLVDPRRVEEGERERLIDEIYNFRIIPAGRHLWMSGVEGRQFLFNCYVSGWGDLLSEHFAFTFNQLMEGGGVGSNYSKEFVNPQKYPVRNLVRLQLYCDPSHENYQDLVNEGLLTNDAHEAWKVPDSREGWTRALERLIEASTTYMRDNPSYRQYLDDSSGEYIPVLRFDLSNIRPAGRPIKTFGGTSAGPVPLAKMLVKVNHFLGDAWLNGMDGPTAMHIDHAIAECVVSGNVRRSARMSIMRWDDPNIEWFLDCKKDDGKFWSTNISVEIDDEFIAAVNQIRQNGVGLSNAELFSPEGRAEYARRVYRKILEGMLRNGEPGIWNSSLANVGEPNQVIATNPCGEICLEPWENCNLGHVNLDAFVNSDGSVDYGGLMEAHRLMTRFLIRATYGDISDAKTRSVVDRNRRIGVGHFGFAGFVAKRGIKYSDSWKPVKARRGYDGMPHDVVSISEELTAMYSTVAMSAAEYSHELRIPMPVKLTTVAPTGTIAKLPGRSEGIHPVYARYFIRRIRYSTVDPDQVAELERFRSLGYNTVTDPDTAYTEIVEIPTKEILVEELEKMGIDPDVLESVDEISLSDMLKVQKMYQDCYADNAVSFTANIPDGKYSVEDLEEIITPFLSSLKGTTLMPDATRSLAPYERLGRDSFEALAASQAVSADASYDEACASGACPVR